MKNREIQDHPDISWTERTGYPSWAQEPVEEAVFDEDAAYEEKQERQVAV